MASPYKRLHNQSDYTASTDNTDASSSTRNPLTFLSPNNWHRTSSSSSALEQTPVPASVTPEKVDHPSCSPDHLVSPTDVVSLLHQQVLELVPEDDESCEEKLQLLQGKLEKIQVGLRAIDQERRELVDKCQQLESEKSRVEQQLKLREREIGTLSKRCAQQMAQAKEATLIRRTHRDLNSKVQELTEELSKSDVQECQVVKSVKQQLLECQRDRDQLRSRLGSIQQDYDKVTDSLQDCLQRIATLTTKQKQWEEEKAMSTRASNQQRLQHSVVVQRLQRTISIKEEEINRLNQSVKSTQVHHERYINELEGRHGATLSEMQQEHQSRLSQLTKDLHVRATLCEQRDAQVEQLQFELKQRDVLIVTLENEVATTMEKLMSATSTLQKAEEDSSMFLALTCDIESLEQERESLSERLHDREISIAELSAEILKLEVEKHLEAERATSMCLQLEQARLEIGRLKEQLESPCDNNAEVDRKLQQSRIENQQLSVALESKDVQLSRSTSLVEELQHRLEESVSLNAQHNTPEVDDLRTALKEARTRIALQEDEIRDLRVIELIDLEDKLRQARKEVVELSRQLLATNDTLKRCKHDSNSESRPQEQLDVIQGLNQTITELTEEVERHNVSIREQERQLKESNADVSILKQQLAAKQQLEVSLRAECRELQSMLDTLQGQYNQLATEVTAAGGAVENESKRLLQEWSEREAAYLDELDEERRRREVAEADAKEACNVKKLLLQENTTLKAKIQQHESASEQDSSVLKERSNTRGATAYSGSSAAATVRRTASRLYRAAAHRPINSEHLFEKAAMEDECSS